MFPIQVAGMPHVKFTFQLHKLLTCIRAERFHWDQDERRGGQYCETCFALSDNRFRNDIWSKQGVVCHPELSVYTRGYSIPDLWERNEMSVSNPFLVRHISDGNFIPMTRSASHLENIYLVEGHSFSSPVQLALLTNFTNRSFTW